MHPDLQIFGDTIHFQYNNMKNTMNGYSHYFLHRFLESLKYQNHTVTVLYEYNTTIAGHPFLEIQIKDKYKDCSTMNKFILTIQNISLNNWLGLHIQYSANDQKVYYK